MTLKQTIELVERVASTQPSINMIVGNDVFKLNAIPDARYGVFAWTQGNHTASVEGNTHRFAFTFFYVDRLTEDKSNMVEIQSTGIETLNNILLSLDEMGVFVNDYTFTTFNERFTDECAGVFVNVALDVPIASECGEDFPTREIDVR